MQISLATALAFLKLATQKGNAALVDISCMFVHCWNWLELFKWICNLQISVDALHICPQRQSVHHANMTFTKANHASLGVGKTNIYTIWETNCCAVMNRPVSYQETTSSLIRMDHLATASHGTKLTSWSMAPHGMQHHICRKKVVFVWLLRQASPNPKE